ncbi:hypothetical protein BDY19DRAFT_904430 [Irpex rosettiformis]|uniref:Uncharacterized protein n=1 Tax=Irpex rosettiformis TaxID=378272 RepID=A0ACB8U9F4_9APHY|nr:hypothetical protein BDY19DRAFT_904430 [Irpex rosettiformis]
MTTRRIALSVSLYVRLAAVTQTLAQDVPVVPATPLVSQIYPDPSSVPYQIYPNHDFVRGPQTGYNRCNASTENQDSLCQTAHVNNLTDFCLWAPPMPNSTIADTEAEEVAWCTTKGHGTRLMLNGTLQAVQVLNAPDYVMVVGLIDQTKLNIRDGDYGGECDYGGADLAGNPLGGLVYSTKWGANGQPGQILYWTEFIGNNQFCFKICKPDGTNPRGYCQHTLDRIGVAYNCPSKFSLGGGAADGTFEVCDSDNMEIPGIYTLPGGQTTSYAQPPESLGPIQTVPYDPVAPSSSNCQATPSSVLYSDFITLAVSPPTSLPVSSGSGSSGPAQPTSSRGTSASGSESAAAGLASPTTSAADSLHVPLRFVAVLGTLCAAAFLA